MRSLTETRAASIWRAVVRTSAGRAISRARTRRSGLRSWPDRILAKLHQLSTLPVRPGSRGRLTRRILGGGPRVWDRQPMHKLLCRAVAIGALVIIGSASRASAGDLKLTINNGLVTLVAQDVPIRQILAEWARLGQTTIVNADKLNGPPLTLQLVDRPEREVLDVVLKSASGYIAAQRPVLLANASQFDRVMILPISHGPVGVAAAPPQPQFGPGRGNMGPQMQLPPPVADEDEPMDPPGPTQQPMVTQPGPPFPNAPP